MARIVITIEDNQEGGVKVVSNPNFETMMKMVQSGETLTSAHGYALHALNSIRKESKKQESVTRIIVPRLFS